MESARECRSESIAQEKHKKCVLINCLRILIILASFSWAESYETGQNKLSETYRRPLKATEGHSFSAALESDSEARRMGTKDISR